MPDKLKSDNDDCKGKRDLFLGKQVTCKRERIGSLCASAVAESVYGLTFQCILFMLQPRQREKYL